MDKQLILPDVIIIIVALSAIRTHEQDVNGQQHDITKLAYDHCIKVPDLWPHLTCL